MDGGGSAARRRRWWRVLGVISGLVVGVVVLLLVEMEVGGRSVVIDQVGDLRRFVIAGIMGSISNLLDKQVESTNMIHRLL